MLRRLLLFLFFGTLGVAIFLFFVKANEIDVAMIQGLVSDEIKKELPVNADIEPQQPLANPPEYIKAIYLTNWSAGSAKKMVYVLKLLRDTELNAVVIDIKDFSGYVGYNTDLELPKKYNAVELRISFLNKMIKQLHDEDIYVIGRISVFQDQRLAIARPDLALHSKSKLFNEYDWKPGSENSTALPE